MNFSYLTDPENWQFGEPGSFPQLILSHLGYSALALLLGVLIALPVGLYIGHTGRGSFLAINAGNAGRSLPTLGLLMLMVTLLGLGLLPVLIALTVLVIPPILTSTYAGMRNVDHAVVDAARGMGMRPWQVLTRVEFPMALPVIMGGFRSAALQVIATATVAASVGLGGLGRLLIDGLAVNDYSRVLAGAVVVAVLAVVLDLLLALVQRWVVSPGLSGRVVRTTV
ncbi:putative ABC transporter permease protein [Actinoplanes missouriensis 431]|uniref:Putative ABC transporter permease protein n=1 Tax=Actinoplanes missouriensis (strain ATCC 14538 / DSM 43046 / CBS 188.64 / JCM 3121 / NBRC 102363 / NCIMB 12654 / NRRL B-3342 / UNCC 431) TaxID=512565 RepID=I0HBI2_ACTM4|nr:ABC transporter permease [Actinoplanes missouriensis]BAL90369.1 putative ABC transporter permease protein [Actinoplanes missouriensis 431]